MALRKIKNVYYVYFRDMDGKLKTRSLKVRDPQKAKNLHDIYMGKLRYRKGLNVVSRDFPDMMPMEAPQRPADGTHKRGGLMISDMLECAKKKRHVGESNLQAWNNFAARIGVKFADQVTPEVALQYLETYYNTGNGKTFNNQKSALNTIFRCCLVEAKMQESPFRSIINKRVTEIASHRNLTLEEFQRVFDAGGMDVKVMAMLSRWTSQRLETCARITPAMLDWERRVIVINPGKTWRYKKWVCCPIMPELAEFLQSISNAFVGHPDRPIVQAFGYNKDNTFSAKFSRLLDSLGIHDNENGKASFHSLRGTAITWYKEHGVKGEELRQITGHESDAVEDIYARDIASVSKIAMNFPS